MIKSWLDTYFFAVCCVHVHIWLIFDNHVFSVNRKSLIPNFTEVDCNCWQRQQIFGFLAKVIVNFQTYF